MISNIVSVAHGLSTGQNLVSTYSLENSVRAGRDALTTSLFQGGEIYTVLSVVERLFKAMGKAALPLSMYRICCLTPFVTIYLANKLKNETVRQIFLKIEDNMGALCQVAMTVSSVALIAFGQAFFGYASLLMLVIGYLDRQGILPEQTRQILHKYANPFSLSLGVVTATSSFEFLFALFMLFSVASDYLPKNAQENYSLPDEPKLLKNEGFARILMRQAAVKINPRYLLERPMLPVPKIDITVLKIQFNQIVWDQGTCNSLRGKLKNDRRFISDHGTVKGKTDQELIQYARKTLRELVTTINNRHIAAGEPGDYDRMTDYLKTIAHILQNGKNLVTKTDALLRLAVEGGEYCGPGKYEVVEDVYFSLIGEKATLRKKILLCLQDFRRGLFNKVFDEEARGLSRIFDTHDLHFYNTQVKIYGEHFALHRGSAENDSNALVDAFSRKFLFYTGGRPFREAFEEGHTQQGLIECVQRAFGTPQLPADKFETWLKGWIEREVQERGLKQQALKDAADHEYDRIICEGGKFRPAIRPEYIRAFLVDMGILEIV